MKLRINDQTEEFIPLATFRKTWGLPDSFQIALFEPKDHANLGSLEQAGPQLAQIRAHVISAVPHKIELLNLLTTVEALSQQFRHALIDANTQIGLQTVEIEFAQSGFEDILRAAIDQLIRLNYEHHGNSAKIQAAFDFTTVYQQWLDNSVRISSEPKTFCHGDQAITIRVIYNAYGRVGMAAEIDTQVHYIADTSLACPAASFMKDLCHDVTGRLRDALVASL